MVRLLIASMLIATALGLSGCGVADSINGACKGSDLQGGCDLLFGYKDHQQDERIDSNESFIFALNRELMKLINGRDENLQLQINALQAQMTELATKQTTVSLVDPCDDYQGHYDEVLMRIEDGRLVAYFESGGQRHLTVLLPNVQYQTTDDQKCKFSINEFNQIVY